MNHGDSKLKKHTRHPYQTTLLKDHAKKKHAFESSMLLPITRTQNYNHKQMGTFNYEMIKPFFSLFIVAQVSCKTRLNKSKTIQLANHISHFTNLILKLTTTWKQKEKL
jgi:hypothetical protein